MFKYTNPMDDDVRALIDGYLISFFEIQVDSLQEATEFSDSEEFQGVLSDLFPHHLVVSDPEKCQKITVQLLEYLQDEYHHEMNALFEYPIQIAFSKIQETKSEFKDDFYPTYYQGASKKEILKRVKTAFAEDIKRTEADDGEKMTDEDLLDFYIDDENFSDWCFEDSDALFVEDLFHCDETNKIQDIVDFEGIDIDYFLPLLPPDIVEQFKKAKKVTPPDPKTFEA